MSGKEVAPPGFISKKPTPACCSTKRTFTSPFGVPNLRPLNWRKQLPNATAMSGTTIRLKYSSGRILQSPISNSSSTRPAPLRTFCVKAPRDRQQMEQFG